PRPMTLSWPSRTKSSVPSSAATTSRGKWLPGRSELDIDHVSHAVDLEVCLPPQRQDLGQVEPARQFQPPRGALRHCRRRDIRELGAANLDPLPLRPRRKRDDDVEGRWGNVLDENIAPPT